VRAGMTGGSTIALGRTSPPSRSRNRPVRGWASGAPACSAGLKTKRSAPPLQSLHPIGRDARTRAESATLLLARPEASSGTAPRRPSGKYRGRKRSPPLLQSTEKRKWPVLPLAL
jgi:hypothetical protein